MRTTLTLDEDISAKLKAEARRSGRPFKQVVNDLLRRALNTRAGGNPRRRFRVQAHPMGLRAGLSYDHVSELLEQLEGPSHR